MKKINTSIEYKDQQTLESYFQDGWNFVCYIQIAKIATAPSKLLIILEKEVKDEQAKS